MCHEFGINMIAKELKDSSCIINMILCIKCYIFMIILYILEKYQGFYISKDKDFSCNEINRSLNIETTFVTTFKYILI